MIKKEQILDLHRTGEIDTDTAWDAIYDALSLGMQARARCAEILNRRSLDKAANPAAGKAVLR